MHKYIGKHQDLKMKNIEVLFLCTTQYQLLSACNLIEMEQIKNITCICVVDIFENAENIISKLLLKKFLIVRLKMGGKFNKFFKLMQMLKECMCLKKKLHSSINTIYIPSQNGYSLIFYNFFSDRGNAEFRYFDEGLYSYISDFNKKPFVEYLSGHKKLCFAFKHLKINYKKSVFLYSPEISFSKNSCNVKKISFFSDIAKLFVQGEIDPVISRKKVIFFDNYFIDNSNEHRKYLLLLQKLVRSKLDVVIKKHPRSDYSSKSSITIDSSFFVNDKNLWEAEISDINISNKLLISNFSSAVLMPSIIFNYRYTAVLFYPYIMGKDFKLNRMLNQLISRILANRDVKIVCLNSMEEIEGFISEHGFVSEN